MGVLTWNGECDCHFAFVFVPVCAELCVQVKLVPVCHGLGGWCCFRAVVQLAEQDPERALRLVGEGGKVSGILGKLQHGQGYVETVHGCPSFGSQPEGSSTASSPSAGSGSAWLGMFVRLHLRLSSEPYRLRVCRILGAEHQLHLLQQNALQSRVRHQSTFPLCKRHVYATCSRIHTFIIFRILCMCRNGLKSFMVGFFFCLASVSACASIILAVVSCDEVEVVVMACMYGSYLGRIAP